MPLTNDNSEADSIEEARLAVKSFNRKVSHVMNNVPREVTETYENMELTKNDAIIVGYFKSGTNWMDQICHQIKMRGTDEGFEELTNEVPLIDVFGPLTGANLTKEQKGDFRLFRSHSTYEQLPECSKKAKFVIILREPHNTFASFYQWETRFIGELAPYADNITLDNFYNERLDIPYLVSFSSQWTSGLIAKRNSAIAIANYQHGSCS